MSKHSNRFTLLIILAVLLSFILGCFMGAVVVGLTGYLTAETTTPDINTRALPPDSMPERLEPQAPVLPDMPRGYQVAVITDVIEDSPAESAGLRVGDAILQADGRYLNELETLSEAVVEKEPGDTIAFTIVRGGRERTVEVKLGRHPDDRGVAWLGISYHMVPSVRFHPEEPR